MFTALCLPFGVKKNERGICDALSVNPIDRDEWDSESNEREWAHENFKWSSVYTCDCVIDVSELVMKKTSSSKFNDMTRYYYCCCCSFVFDIVLFLFAWWFTHHSMEMRRNKTHSKYNNAAAHTHTLTHARTIRRISEFLLCFLQFVHSISSTKGRKEEKKQPAKRFHLVIVFKRNDMIYHLSK